jgi:cyclomaltodextrinase / maltogenic alpha-amylase / neopullulanase
LMGGDDPACRGAFPWGSAAVDNHPVGETVRQIGRLRHRHRVLREGDFLPVVAQRNAVAFERRLGRSRMVVILNANPRPVHFDIGVSALLWGQAALSQGRVSVPARSAAILRV